MRVNQLRGQVKVAARQAVPENFGFKNSKDIANINEIRQQIEKLKECNAYIYKVRHSLLFSGYSSCILQQGSNQYQGPKHNVPSEDYRGCYL